MLASAENSCALILAGGRGQRMNGEDKGLIPWHGKLLVEHVLLAVPDNLPVIISANRNLEHYRRLARQVVSDRIGEYAGPLAGIYSAMKSDKESGFFLVLPCDAPVAPADLFNRLAAAINQGNYNIAVAHDGERMQPLFGLYRASLRDALEHALKNEFYKVQRFVQDNGMIEVDFSDQPGAFANFNRPEELND